MEAFNIKDMEKPYKIKQENVNGFKKKMENKIMLKDSEKKLLIQIAKPSENFENQFADYSCKICLLFGYDPVTCSVCEKVVVCRKCKDDWKRSLNGVFKCPS